MDVKVIHASPNGTLLILPDVDSSSRPPFALSAVYLTLSSVAIVSNIMVLSGILTSDRLRTPYAVLVSALCLQCALDSAVGHYLVTKDLLSQDKTTPGVMTASSFSDNVATVQCRVVATVTAALPNVQLITFAALSCLNAFARPDYVLPAPAAAVLWAVPSLYTYVILTPTLLLSTRYFPLRGRCGFTGNSTGWFYPTLLIAFGLVIPWSVSFYLVFVSRPSTATTRAARGLLASGDNPRPVAELMPPCKRILAAYTALVMPGYIWSCTHLYRDDPEGIFRSGGNAHWEYTLDGYLCRLSVVFDVLVPFVLINYHKVFRKKCRDLYLHGFRNSVSDDSSVLRKALSAGRRHGEDRLTDDAPVLFLEDSGVISVRTSNEDGFTIKACDLDEDGNTMDGKSNVRFSRRVSAIHRPEQPKNEESRF
ncbi:uncharacterized protein LOC126833428 [Adelges cooleyi]|uniref:uncharacterized protein LOC126833428 n=1 Tax=Adelges cooleyi TaxID=133065 RepID=UPI0021801EED|nr:uncharacterized protein LOC126833428 [Adelges cooleyi]